MNALAERPVTGAVCPHCGAGLASDQDWCLECGAGVRIRIRQAPDWRIPLLIVAGVVALVATGFVIALVALSNASDRSVAAGANIALPAPATAVRKPATPNPPNTAAKTTTPTTTARAATTTAITTPTTAVESWPTGVTGFTVVLGVIPAKGAATASAKKIAASGIPVGLLRSSDYSSMHPGDWIVFSGTYTTRTQADAAATRLQAQGQPGAYEFPVVPAG